jgi:hypothetical protein
MKITVGVASTTHIDLHNERLTKSALDGMADQIKHQYIPQLIEHDWNRCVGVLLYGEVFQLQDGENALGIVTGIFENKEEKNKFKPGKPNVVWQDYKKYLKIEELISLSDKKKPDLVNQTNVPINIAQLLENYLDSTHILPDGRVYRIKRFVAATGDLRIEFYPKDHRPSHFHIISKQRGINARFDIHTLEPISIKEGKIKKDDIKKIQDFFRNSPAILAKLKNEHQRMQQR